jgi:hypothetical protein
MTRDDIIRMAEQAGAHHLANVPGFTDFLTRFAALAYEAGAAAEREACAIAGGAAADAGLDVAAAIRAQGQPDPKVTHLNEWARNKLARHGIQLPDDEEYGNPSF